jgi:hypothetical protein
MHRYFVLSLTLSLGLWAGPLKVTETDDAISIANGDKPLLTYHKALVPPPKGVDPAYHRSGFIHPIHTPSGAVVTGIHPKDHYHHVGLWHAWVNTKHAGDKVDFWNLKKKEATVRFKRTVKLIDSGDHVGFVVEQEHARLKPQGQVVLAELFTVAARLIDGAYVLDYTTEQMNVSKAKLEFPAYRYGGGIAYRAPHNWSRPESDYLTSAGKTRKDGHTTRGNWCAMYGATGDAEFATLSILCHPENHDAPQRMRIWDDNPKTFFNYVPIQEHAWGIEPGQKSVMRYRIVVQDGKPQAGDLNARWAVWTK